MVQRAFVDRADGPSAESAVGRKASRGYCKKNTVGQADYCWGTMVTEAVGDTTRHCKGESVSGYYKKRGTMKYCSYLKQAAATA